MRCSLPNTASMVFGMKSIFAQHELVSAHLAKMGITMPEWFNQISEIHEKGATHWQRLNIGHRRLSNNSIAFP